MTFFDWLNAVHWVLLPFGPIIIFAIFGTIIALMVNLFARLFKWIRKINK